jgi:hypothetical protein
MKNFKRLSVLLLMAILTIGVSQAQFRFGIKAGLNFNKLKNSTEELLSSDNGCGFTGGVMTEFQVPIVGLCFDASLMYTRMSADLGVNEIVDNVISKDENAKNFFEIPINVKYKFQIPAVSSIVAPYLFTGPSFAFKLGGDESVLTTKTFQCAWNIGVGVELIKHLQISGSYGFGINNVANKYLGVKVSDNYKLKNNYWTLTAAYLF